MMRGSYKVGCHIFVWLSYVTFAIFVFGYDVSIKDYVAETTISVCISAVIFYTHLYLILPFYDKRKYWVYIVALVLSYFLNFSLRYLFAFYIYKAWFGVDSSIVHYSLVKLFLVFSWQWLPFIFFSAGYWSALRRWKSEEDKKRLSLENAVLRAQIDPHFLFNTFNSLRLEAEDVLPDVANGISAVIQILRSALAKPGLDGLIPLEQELKVVDSLVLIYRRRYPDMALAYTKNIDNASGYRIVPHLLVAFIENLFKFGSKKSNAQNSILLVLQNGNLFLEAYNKKADLSNADSFHIGTDYIKSNLEAQYKDAHELDIRNNPEDYLVRLSITRLNYIPIYDLYHY